MYISEFWQAPISSQIKNTLSSIEFNSVDHKSRVKIQIDLIIYYIDLCVL